MSKVGPRCYLNDTVRNLLCFVLLLFFSFSRGNCGGERGLILSLQAGFKLLVSSASASWAPGTTGIHHQARGVLFLKEDISSDDKTTCSPGTIFIPSLTNFVVIIFIPTHPLPDQVEESFLIPLLHHTQWYNTYFKYGLNPTVLKSFCVCDMGHIPITEAITGEWRKRGGSLMNNNVLSPVTSFFIKL